MMQSECRVGSCDAPRYLCRAPRALRRERPVIGPSRRSTREAPLWGAVAACAFVACLGIPQLATQTDLGHAAAGRTGTGQVRGPGTERDRQHESEPSDEQGEQGGKQKKQGEQGGKSAEPGEHGDMQGEQNLEPADAKAMRRHLSWPEDKATVIAEAAGREITLEELVRHVTERHDPQFRDLLGTRAGNAYFRSPHAAQWVRQYADIVALQAEARQRGLDPAASEAALSAALKKGFEAFLASYSHGRESGGRPLELSQDRVNELLARYQRELGLGVERQGWIDALVPNDFPEAEVWKFYQQHPDWFGGRVDLAHVLVQHRDGETGQLLPPAERRAALARVEDVRNRLAPDGSNFDVVARAHSDDKRSAARGGELKNVARFDPRLPSALIAAAWSLEDGKWTGPIETPYGVHFVKRLRYHAMGSFVYAPSNRAEVQETMWRHLQEEMLDAVREEHRVKLRY